MTREECITITGDEELLFVDGHDNAITGVAQRFNDFFVVYDQSLVISNLMKDDMTYDEAIDFFHFNISGAYVGNSTPAFLHKSDG